MLLLLLVHSYHTDINLQTAETAFKRGNQGKYELTYVFLVSLVAPWIIPCLQDSESVSVSVSLEEADGVLSSQTLMPEEILS